MVRGMTAFDPRALKRGLSRVFHAAGLDVRRRVPQPRHALATLLSLYRVETVFDVGANAGMSAEYLRNIGFRGRIVSFEPVKDLFGRLAHKASQDPLWNVENVALGSAEGEGAIHVSGGGGSASSFLRMTPAVTDRAPELAVLRTETVAVSTIDEMAARYYPAGDRLFVKLDVQGYEMAVLEGARASLGRIVGLRIEVALVESYDAAPLFHEVLPRLYTLGYRLTGVEYAWSDPATQEIYELDAILFRPGKA